MKTLTSAVACCAATLAGLGAGPLPTAPVHAATATTAATCKLEGSLTVTPGWGPLPEQEGITLSGSATCTGLIGNTVSTPLTAAPSFGADLQCPVGSMEGAACSAGVVMSPFNCSGGAAVQVGLSLSISCVGSDGYGPVSFDADVLIVPDPLVQGTDIQSFLFSGEAVAGGA